MPRRTQQGMASPVRSRGRGGADSPTGLSIAVRGALRRRVATGGARGWQQVRALAEALTVDLDRYVSPA